MIFNDYGLRLRLANLHIGPITFIDLLILYMIHEQTQKEQNTKIIKRRIEKFQIKNRIDTISTNDFVEALTIAYNKYLNWINEDKAIIKKVI